MLIVIELVVRTLQPSAPSMQFLEATTYSSHISTVQPAPARASGVNEWRGGELVCASADANSLQLHLHSPLNGVTALVRVEFRGSAPTADARAGGPVSTDRRRVLQYQ